MSEARCRCDSPLIRAIVWTAAIPVGLLVLIREPYQLDWFAALMMAWIVYAAVGGWIDWRRARGEP